MNKSKLLRHFVGVGCALAAGGVAGLALWSWVAGVSDLLSFDPHFIPMAPSTAMVVLLIASALLVWVRRPSFRRALAYAYAVAILALFSGVLAVLRPWLGWALPLDAWLARSAFQQGVVPMGQTSPVTGALFVGVAVALLLRLPPQGRLRGTRWGAALVCGAVLALSAGVALCYDMGSPWLFDGTLIPPALPTTLAFLWLGIALLVVPPPALSPHETPDWRPPFVRLPWLLMLLTVLLFGVVSASYMHAEQAERRDDLWQHINSVAALKVAEFGHWRSEHWDTVHYFGSEPDLADAAREFLRQPQAAAARALLLRRFVRLEADPQISLVALFDTNATVRLVRPEQPDQPPTLAAELVEDMLRKRRLLMTNLHFDLNLSYSHIDLVLPLFAGPAADAPPAGYILVRLDPHVVLFPRLMAWPTPNRSGAVQLVRRDGHDALLLTARRERTQEALPARIPLDPHSREPVVMAALGRTGAVEGLDCRGVPVLADIRAIPDTDCLFITRVNREELLAPLRQHAWLTLLLTLALTAMVTVALWLMRKQREIRIIRGDLALEQERRALAERVEVLMKNASDIILIADERGHIIEANERAVQAYGYAREELQRLLLTDLRPTATRADFALEHARLLASGSAIFNTVHQRKDGSTFPVEVSARTIAFDGVASVMGIVRDITERTAQEREIARLTRLYATLSEINQCLVRIASREELFREVCRITVECSGFKLAWIGWLDTTTHAVVPVGRAGADQGYLDTINVSIDDRPAGRGPVGTCLREGRPCVFNSFLEDPRALPWHDAALAHSLRAVAAFPLRLGGALCGAFTVYADEPGVFQDKERALLEEAAAYISFALDNLARAEQQRQTDAALHESEERYRRLVEKAPDTIYVQCGGKIVFINPAGLRLLGATQPEQLLGRPYIDLIHPGDRGRVAARAAIIGGRGAVPPLEERYLRLDGSTVPVEVSVIPTTYAGQPAAQVLVHDITARKQAELALRQSEEQFRTMFELASIGMSQADPHTGRFQRVNRQLCAITGYSEAELLGKCIREITHPDDRDIEGAAFQRVIRGEQPAYQLEKRYIRKDGSPTWVNINMTVIRSAQGRPLRSLATSEDITGRRLAEMALRENEARYRSLFENMRNGWSYCRMLYEEGRPHDFVYLAVNAAFAAQTGLKDVVGRKVSEVIPGILETDPGLIAAYGRVAQTGEPEHLELYVEALRMWFALSLYSPQQDHFIAVFDVITERKRLEEERELTVRVLSLLSTPTGLDELIQQVTLLLHDWSGCEAVGIRLREGGDFPYFATRGFPAEFVKVEDQLCECDAAGLVPRDASGQPTLACLCGNVLRGRFDPTQPFFTARGSFWTNDTTRLLATTTAADRLTNTRNRCNGAGYESVALVALRTDTTTYGLLQLNDKRKHRFTAERIALLERLADSLAIGIAHRQDQMRLRASEEKYRQLVDNATEVIYVAQNGIIQFANRLCAQLTGFSEAELVGKSSNDFVVPEEREHVAQHQARLARGETPAGSEEFRTRLRDGTEHWLSVSSVQIQWHDRPATLNFAADITARKQAEMALVEVRNDLAETFDCITDMVTVHDLQFNITRANKAAQHVPNARLLDEVLGAKYFPCGPDMAQDPEGCPSYGNLRAGKATSSEVFEPHLKRHLEIRAIPRYGPDQQLRGLIHIVRDITERKRAEAELQLQGAALAAAANAIVITDGQGTIEWVNPAFTACAGYALDEARGRNPRDLIKSGEHDAEYYRELWATILAGRVWHGEVVNRRKDGTLYTEDMTITPLRDEAGVIAHFIAIKQDITERKTLETQLLRNQRLESVGRLASGVAHDLNNILAPMLLAPSLLRAELHNPEALSLVNTIEASAQRGAEIIKQLLTFGRGLKGERIPLQLRTLVREMLKLMRETFPKDIIVRTQLPAEVPLVTGDATQLHQILMNLCVNARDAMPAGGELTLSLEPVVLEAAAAAALSGAQPGRYVILGVGDSGTGIAPENLDKIFDPFFTTKPIGEGTGLGLSTVLGIVRSHAGFMQVQNAPGQGTRFQIYLPVSQGAAATPVAAAPAPGLPRGHGQLVLVVDDEESLRRMTCRILKSNGYRILEAQDGVEALELLARAPEPPLVLVTDLIMPRMDGPTLIRMVLKQGLGLKIIALGGLPPPPEVLRGLGLSLQTFVAKPFDSAALLTAIRAALGAVCDQRAPVAAHPITSAA